jgi:hypothetical protein
MGTHTTSDGSPFTPFTAAVLAWRKGGKGSDRAYASGMVIHEDVPEQGNQRITLWLFQTMSGFDGATLIPLPHAGLKFTQECAFDEAWAPIVQEWERKLAQELGEDWKVEIRLNPYGDRPEKIKRV